MAMFKYAILPVLFFLFISGDRDDEKTIFNRIEYLYGLKTKIASASWPAFDDVRKPNPMIYFTGTSSYAVNPTSKFLRQFQAYLILEKNNIRIFKTASRMDNIPFHMENHMTIGNDSSLCTHYQPFIKCSGLEDTRNVLPDVTVSEWVGMVIHEFFHNHQFQHAEFAQRTLNLFRFGSPGDSLQALYRDHLWYREYVDKENKLLIRALETNNHDSVKALIQKFFKTRERRRVITQQNLNLTIETFEKSFETFEGTARYIEAAVIKMLSDSLEKEYLRKMEPSSKALIPRIAHPEWLYKADVSQSYFYATGYNITRLLEKLEIPYQQKLFKEPDSNLEDLLWKSL